ncbi:hypothetical protein D1B31_01910 [Neobacillus notoginsengisoli]|uniref:Uncharacterized protein n=1 Tax=Neobacillus notoginsengisoli TaxID=1578198 RepID=A0A417YZW3_9BACI|nr:hypothetical protein [Neobacillus notoginsengisoli]RHW43440.1 hypothetical protein D1B31_01910 [Neobacillus notoginsengisoli]
MIIQWIALFIIICFLAFSYYKRYSLKTRLSFLGALFILSFILMLPVFGLSILTIIGLFLTEKIWLLLAAVLFIETVINKKGRIIKTIFGVVSIVIYLYIRTVI